MFRPRRPSITREELSNEKKLRAFIIWWTKNDNHVNVTNPSTDVIFSAGYRPAIVAGEKPEADGQHFNSAVDWFVAKVSLDLRALRDVSKQEFSDFVDSLNQAGANTLMATEAPTLKYGIDWNRFVYAKEIGKVPEGEERDRFNQLLLDDCMVWSESRILGWVYQQWFGELYQPPAIR